MKNNKAANDRHVVVIQPLNVNNLIAIGQSQGRHAIQNGTF